MVILENCTFSDINFNISAFKSWTFECEAIFLFLILVNDSHQLITNWAQSWFLQHSLWYHPPQSPLEVFSYPENIKIFLKQLFNNISFNRLVSALPYSEISQGSKLFYRAIIQNNLVFKFLNIFIKKSDSIFIQISKKLKIWSKIALSIPRIFLIRIWPVTLVLYIFNNINFFIMLILFQLNRYFVFV